MFRSHLGAATGAVFVESREEQRVLSEITKELPDCEKAKMTAPQGAVSTFGGKGKSEEVIPGGSSGGLLKAIQWASAKPNRVLVVHDWHHLVNAPGHYRILTENLEELRSPKGTVTGEGDASLVVFVGPVWDLSSLNPLKGALPILRLDPPGRERIEEIIHSKLPPGILPAGEEGERVIDALCGLPDDVIEQTAAESLSANYGAWNIPHLRGARKEAMRAQSLEVWPLIHELGGLEPLKDFARLEIVPFCRHPLYKVNRVLCAGLPGTGKSYWGKWLANIMGCECVRLSMPRLKAGIVGDSESNLRKCLAAIDSVSAESPLVLVIDEIDSIARDGNDAGVSSGMFAELCTWLAESQNFAVVIATLNHLDKLDAALESRFPQKFYFDLPTAVERIQISCIWFEHFQAPRENLQMLSETLGQVSEGFSARELAYMVPTIMRRGNLKPDSDTVMACVRGAQPTSVTQSVQLDAMRKAASYLPRAGGKDAGKDAGRDIGRRNIN